MFRNLFAMVNRKFLVFIVLWSVSIWFACRYILSHEQPKTMIMTLVNYEGKKVYYIQITKSQQAPDTFELFNKDLNFVYSGTIEYHEQPKH